MLQFADIRLFRTFIHLFKLLPYGEGGLLNGRKTGICRHPNVIFLCSLTGFHNFATIISQMKQQNIA